MEGNNWSWLVGYVLGTASYVAGQWLARREHRREIEALHASYARLLETRQNVETYGAARLPEAATTDPEPQPEERAQVAVTEAMIERGMNDLREAYRTIGAYPNHITDDLIREEALSMLNSIAPEPPRSLDGFVARD